MCRLTVVHVTFLTVGVSLLSALEMPSHAISSQHNVSWTESISNQLLNTARSVLQSHITQPAEPQPLRYSCPLQRSGHNCNCAQTESHRKQKTAYKNHTQLDHTQLQLKICSPPIAIDLLGTAVKAIPWRRQIIGKETFLCVHSYPDWLPQKWIHIRLSWSDYIHCVTFRQYTLRASCAAVNSCSQLTLCCYGTSNKQPMFTCRKKSCWDAPDATR